MIIYIEYGWNYQIPNQLDILNIPSFSKARSDSSYLLCNFSTNKMDNIPNDISQLIASYIDKKEDIKSLLSVSKHQNKNTIELMKRLQKIEWSFLLRDEKTNEVSNDFIKNEENLKSFGVSTFPLTPNEQKALINAYNSIYEHPLPLTKEQKEYFLKKYAPIYSQLIGLLPITSWDEEKYDTKSIKDSYIENFTRGPEESKVPSLFHEYDTICQPILCEASFEDFLKVFAVDSERNNAKNFTSILLHTLFGCYESLSARSFDHEKEYMIFEFGHYGDDDQLKRELLSILCLRSLNRKMLHEEIFNLYQLYDSSSLSLCVIKTLILVNHDFTILSGEDNLFQMMANTIMDNPNYPKPLELLLSLIERMSSEQILSQLVDKGEFEENIIVGNIEGFYDDDGITLETQDHKKISGNEQTGFNSFIEFLEEPKDGLILSYKAPAYKNHFIIVKAMFKRLSDEQISSLNPSIIYFSKLMEYSILKYDSSN